MKTKLIILSALIFTGLLSYSQENKIEPVSKRAQSAFLELGGNGIILSANYETRFAKKQNGFGGRIGLGIVTDFLDPTSGLTIPVGINYLAGKRNHYLEAGLGATIYTLKGLTLFKDNINEGGVIFVPSLGYRYQPLDGSFVFRIFASPLIGEGSTFWAGLSIGYKF